MHNQALFLAYERFVRNNAIKEEMLFLKSLPDNTTREAVFNEVKK